MSFKEALESRQDVLPDFTSDLVQNTTYIGTICNSLVKGYKAGNISIHFHLASLKGEKFCLMAGSHPVLQDKAASELSEQYSPMLVDVAEFIQNPDNSVFPLIPSVVRLQFLDDCHSLFGNSGETPSPLSILKTFGCSTDGKRISCSGFILRGKHKLPHQIVQRRTEVLEAVSDNQRNHGWNSWPLSSKHPYRIRLKIALQYQLCAFSLEIPTELGSERVIVLFGPEDFKSNGFRQT